MAFCTNCGKSLDEGARFCTNCGTPAQVSTAVPAMIPSAPVAAAPAVAPLPDPPTPASEIREQKPGVTADPPVASFEAPSTSAYVDFGSTPQSSTSPVFVIVCVVLLVLIAGGIAGTVYFQRQGKAKAAVVQSAAETSKPNEGSSSNASPGASVPASTSAPVTSVPSTATSTPAPSVSSPAPATPQPISSAVPVAESIRAMNLGSYPGATPVAIATLTGETVVAGFLTRDTPHQVMQFYKVRFPVSTLTESEGKAELSATLPGGERVRIQAQPQGTNTQVIVFQEN